MILCSEINDLIQEGSMLNQQIEKIKEEEKFPQNTFNEIIDENIADNISQFLNIKDLKNVYLTFNERVNFLFKQPLKERKYQLLVQAVVDDNRKQVKAILNQYPELLHETPKIHENLVIESQYTWQKFYAEKILINLSSA
jgi:hypothetical protein